MIEKKWVSKIQKYDIIFLISNGKLYNSYSNDTFLSYKVSFKHKLFNKDFLMMCFIICDAQHC